MPIDMVTNPKSKTNLLWITCIATTFCSLSIQGVDKLNECWKHFLHNIYFTKAILGGNNNYIYRGVLNILNNNIKMSKQSSLHFTLLKKTYYLELN